MTFEIPDLEYLPLAAKEFLLASEAHKILAFSGEMGVGKTTFIKAVCAELGVLKTASSPTFSLVNEYLTKDGQKVYHFDFYRLKNQSEALDMGIEEYFDSGFYCLLEWPEKISDFLPQNALSVQLSLRGNTRILSF
jgi:tRNA threonylcarbamoyladenosine biosynthesis protein TsaE